MSQINLDNEYKATQVDKSSLASKSVVQAAFEIVPKKDCGNCGANKGNVIPLMNGQFSCNLAAPRKGQASPREATFQCYKDGSLATIVGKPNLSVQDEGSHVVLPCDAIRKLGPIAQKQLREE